MSERKNGYYKFIMGFCKNKGGGENEQTGGELNK